LGGEPDPGPGGGEPADECAVTGAAPLDAPIAKTRLDYVAPTVVSLGQGYSSRVRTEGSPLSEGCVVGQETNGSALNLTGAQVSGGGTRTLGVFDWAVPQIQSSVPREPVPPFQAALSVDAVQSVYAFADVSISLWGYFMLNEAQSPAVECGEAFVRTVSPSRRMAVAFKVTLPTTAERDQFLRCFPYPNDDILAFDNPNPASRYLTAHHATLAIHVLRVAGSAEETQKILEETKCSAANLPACATTLNSLSEQQNGLVKTPSNTLALAQLTPDWTMVDFEVSPYSILP